MAKKLTVQAYTLGQVTMLIISAYHRSDGEEMASSDITDKYVIFDQYVQERE